MKRFLTNKTNLIAFLLTVLLAAPLLSVSAAASLGIEVPGSAGFGSRDIKETISQVLNVILGFLGLIAVIIILLGGFKWMTAAGNEDKVAEAKKVLSAGIIGLVIIILAYAITVWVLNTITRATF